MISVSDKWRAAQFDAIVPEMSVEIAYEITEPGLQEIANESNNGAMDYSDHTDIVVMTDNNHPLYATMEHNIWSLNGEVATIPDVAPYGDTGYVSSMISKFDGSFETNPVIDITFGGVREQAIPGITITWSSKYDEYASRFRLQALNGDSVLVSQEFTNSSSVTLCDFPVSDYSRIQIEILEWCLPFHRARVERVFVGIEQRYTKTDLLSYKHLQSADLLSAELPKNSVSFSLNNADGIWNPDNPTGNIKYLAEQQEIRVRYGMKLDGVTEWVKAGTFWISEWDTSSNGMEAKFTARDALEFMSDLYAGTRHGTLYDIAEAALKQADLPIMGDGSARYRIHDSLKELDVDFSDDDSDYTLAEIVQLCANASCCVMYQNRNGILCIEPLRENASGYSIRKYVSYTHPEFALSKPLKSVSVNDGLGVVENAKTGEIQTLDNSLITTEVAATRVAEWVRKTLENRKTLSGDYRADPSLDVLDKISVESKYGINNAIYVTEIEYTYSGAFRGKYTGRVSKFDPTEWYAGELISGEV